ncbi:MAG: hypothetical protein KAU17_13690 [Spirochaetales bacterium]|nr:hypothetical protein [Spirochaetales bacterium]
MIDQRAKEVGRRVLGTGVNPGFLMDTLPLALTGICQSVEKIEITRVINASTRREGFQKKIGCGLSEKRFTDGVASGAIGHVGLPESAGMIAHFLGKKLMEYRISIEPVWAERDLHSEFFAIPGGGICGVKQVLTGGDKRGFTLRLSFYAYLGAPDEADTIVITGTPSLTVKVQGSHGDLSTVGIVVNAIRRLKGLSPGLLTMAEIPPVTSQ